MTIRHLKIFTAVADNGGMSRAAKKLHISQPSISQAIAELEKHYGVKLFERLSQKLYLTKEGELMLSFSRHILDSFEHMEEAMNQAVETTSLRIGCSVSVGTCLINDILDEADRKIPECQISVNVTNSSEIEREILNNEVDLGIVEGILKSKDLVITPVCEDEMVVVCGKSHWLATKERVTLEMLQGQPYISRESGSSERNQIEKMFEDHGVQLRRIFCSTNTEAIKKAVIRGRGIAVFSSRMIEEEKRKGEMIVLPLEEISVTRNINLVIHKNKYLSEEIKALQEILLSRR
nr:LysR family transcriptional regulator [uncultured Faecalimonas sp.]